mgnify:FL=1
MALTWANRIAFIFGFLTEGTVYSNFMGEYDLVTMVGRLLFR